MMFPTRHFPTAPAARRLVLVLAIAAIAHAQATMTAAQVAGFVKSAVQQKDDDRKVAEYLHKITLVDKLEARTVEELRGMGAGPRTVAALRELIEASANLSAAPPPPPKAPPVVLTPPDPDDQKKILAEITENALSYSEGLPNYICTQVTQRNVDPSGTGNHWQVVDKIQEQLTYFEHKESYKVQMVNSKMVTNTDHDQLGGARSSGEFGTTLYEIFDPQTQAEFHWERWATLDAHRMYVFAYRVPQARSHYSIFHDPSQRKIIAGYHGLIYADRDSRTVMRVTLECEEIPADFPIKDVKIDLWYQVTKIADQEFVLPRRYELTSRDERALVRNEAEFRLYRKFGADATITFDSSDDDAPAKKTEEPAVK
jgi:hypothetical protein